MARNKGCLWLYQSYLNDDVFNSEPKYKPIVDIKFGENYMNPIQNSFAENKSALKPTPEPVKIHDNENNISREVIINALVEEKGTFISSFEADNYKIQNGFNDMDETTLKIDFIRRLGKNKGDMSRLRALLVRFTSEWDARKCLSES